MKPSLILISALLAGIAATADGHETFAMATEANQPMASGSTAQGKPYKHRLSFPAGSLSYIQGPHFTMGGDGLDWNGPTGVVTLTVRRPLDYAGGNVRVTVLHQVTDDGDGQISFGITPVAFNNGNVFETYDGVGTDSIPAPLTPDVLFEQSAVIPPVGLGPFGTGNWWYISITRNGSFAGGLRLMSVSLDY